MLKCSECEFFGGYRSDGSPRLLCDPFTTVKEPECLLKWQLVKLDVLSRSHEATLEMHRRVAPMQEKLFNFMEREMDDVDEAERWKYGSDDDEDDAPLA